MAEIRNIDITVTDITVLVPVLSPASKKNSEGSVLIKGVERSVQQFTWTDLDVIDKWIEREWRRLEPHSRQRLTDLIHAAEPRENDSAAEQRGKSETMSHATWPLDSVQFTVWKAPTGATVPALFCPDTAALLAVIALLPSPQGNRLCLCLSCGQPFAARRGDQEYCTSKHRDAHRAARWRARKLEKNQEGN